MITMARLIGALVTLLALMSSVRAFCPPKCVCDNDQLQVTCYQTQLEVRYCFSDECQSEACLEFEGGNYSNLGPTLLI